MAPPSWRRSGAHRKNYRMRGFGGSGASREALPEVFRDGFAACAAPTKGNLSAIARPAPSPAAMLPRLIAAFALAVLLLAPLPARAADRPDLERLYANLAED